MPISIVMPTYNRLNYLREAVESVLAQTYTDWELLISDDGSKDGTREYLRSLKDPRIRAYFQDPNLGQFRNFNFLFANARHEITQILCDDDYFIDNGSLGRLADLWNSLPDEVGMVRVNHSRENAHCSLTRFEFTALPDLIQASESGLYFAIFGSLSGSISNMSVRTALMKENQFRVDLPYAGDFEFWARLASKCSFVISSLKITGIRMHEAQVSSTSNRKGELVIQMKTILEPMYQRLMESGHSPSLLRTMFTVNYASLHRYLAIKALLKNRNGAYLRTVMRDLDHSSMSLGPIRSWIVFFASAGGRMFRVAIARRLLAGYRSAEHS